MAITPHKYDEVERACKVCGAFQRHGRWWSPKDSAVNVTEDCDYARSIIYPSQAVTYSTMGVSGGSGATHLTPPLPRPPYLTPAEIEQLGCLMEECGELIHAAAKILRHGYHSPGYHNRENLTREAGDVIWALNSLIATGVISPATLEERVKEKTEKVKKYLHHQEG